MNAPIQRNADGLVGIAWGRDRYLLLRPMPHRTLLGPRRAIFHFDHLEGIGGGAGRGIYGPAHLRLIEFRCASSARPRFCAASFLPSALEGQFAMQIPCARPRAWLENKRAEAASDVRVCGISPKTGTWKSLQMAHRPLVRIAIPARFGICARRFKSWPTQLGDKPTGPETDSMTAFLGSLTGVRPGIVLPILPGSDAATPRPQP